MTFVDRWKSGESAVGQWLAQTVTGTIVKTGATPMLLWAADQVWSIPPVLQVGIVATIPALVNALNGADVCYGVGARADA